MAKRGVIKRAWVAIDRISGSYHKAPARYIMTTSAFLGQIPEPPKVMEYIFIEIPVDQAALFEDDCNKGRLFYNHAKKVFLIG